MAILIRDRDDGRNAVRGATTVVWRGSARVVFTGSATFRHMHPSGIDLRNLRNQKPIPRTYLSPFRRTDARRPRESGKLDDQGQIAVGL